MNLLLASSLLLVVASSALANGATQMHKVPAMIAVNGPLPAPPAGVTDLKFSEFFNMPVGPRGLEPTDKLLSLNGKKVRLVGFMVRQDVPTRGMFVLSPIRVELGDADESLSDDLPATTVFVHLRRPANSDIAFIPALIKLTGTLQLGPQDEIDGHVSAVRLLLDEAPARAVVKLSAALANSVPPK